MKKIQLFFAMDLNEYVLFPHHKYYADLLQEVEAECKATNTQHLIKYKYREKILNNNLKFYPNLQELNESDIYGETGIEGLKIDFNFGLRLDIPKGNFHVRISDFDSGQIFFDENISDVRLMSAEKYYVHWQVEIFLNGEKIFEHVLDLENQDVFINLSMGGIGDNLAMMPYISEFQKVHNCKVKLLAKPHMRQIISNLYPHIEQIENDSFDYYATFYVFPGMGGVLNLPVDSRTMPLDRGGSLCLGMANIIPSLPKFTPTKKRKIKTPYVCIAVQGSGTNKSWLYPKGWDIVIDYLKSLGYRVLCIDQHKTQIEYGYTIQKPKDAEDFTGNLPLIDRANMLYYADFFIGLSSGLSWLANSVGCKVILIGGFSQDYYEFSTPYRIANRFVCNGCYNDIRELLFTSNVCRRYEGTERELECSKKISPHQVICAIDNLIADKKISATN